MYRHQLVHRQHGRCRHGCDDNAEQVDGQVRQQHNVATPNHICVQVKHDNHHNEWGAYVNRRTAMTDGNTMRRWKDLPSTVDETEPDEHHYLVRECVLHPDSGRYTIRRRDHRGTRSISVVKCRRCRFVIVLGECMHRRTLAQTNMSAQSTSIDWTVVDV